MRKILDQIDPNDGRHVLALLRAGLGVGPRGEVLAVLGEDVQTEAVESYPTVILDVLDQGEIVLRQVEPSLSAARLGSPVELSAIVRGDDGPHRRGLGGELVRVLPEFRLGPDQVEPAFLVKLRSPVQLKALNVRLGVRVDLDSHSLLSFTAKRLPVFPTNISVGGVGFNCMKDQLRVRDQISLDLNIAERRHTVRVKVVRVSGATKKHDYVGGQFIALEQDPASWRRMLDLLHARIMAEQARQIAKDKGVV